MCQGCWNSTEEYLQWSFDAVDPIGAEDGDEHGPASDPDPASQQAWNDLEKQSYEAFCTCDDPASPFCDGPHAP